MVHDGVSELIGEWLACMARWSCKDQTRAPAPRKPAVDEHSEYLQNLQVNADPYKLLPSRFENPRGSFSNGTLVSVICFDRRLARQVRVDICAHTEAQERLEQPIHDGTKILAMVQQDHLAFIVRSLEPEPVDSDDGASDAGTEDVVMPATELEEDDSDDVVDEAPTLTLRNAFGVKGLTVMVMPDQDIHFNLAQEMVVVSGGKVVHAQDVHRLTEPFVQSLLGSIASMHANTHNGADVTFDDA